MLNNQNLLPNKKGGPSKQQNFHCYLLLIEDNMMNRKVAQMILERLGCQLDMAENGTDGLNMYRANQYDLILTDIGLPDMDGTQIIKTIRDIENKTSHIPIIVMTAHVMAEDRNNFIAVGADDVLTKPIMQDQLLNVLNTWIKR